MSHGAQACMPMPATDTAECIAAIRRVAPFDLSDDAVSELARAYAEPVRAYHSLQHVVEVLQHYADVAQGPGWSRPREVFLAVLYHDAIYVPGRRDNEARSAQLARAAIARWLPATGIDIDAVAALIELMARHGRLDTVDVGRDAALFLDCDMAILGADAARFDAYDRAIAAEYRGTMPAWLFDFNRRRFLKALLARPRIYLSDFFHRRLDSTARENLRRTLKRQRSPLRAGAGR